MKLRDYQSKLKNEIYNAWRSGHKNVVAISPTGSGKSVTLTSIVEDLAILQNTVLIDGISFYPTVINVHRKELIQQLCCTLAEFGIEHNIIATKPTIRGIIAAERRLFNKSFFKHTASVTVISVDTLNSRILEHKEWAKSIRLWITDEAAHLLRDNKWGRAVELFPNAIGLGVTATPERLDKRGLGSHVDGVFDTIVIGPTTAQLIEWGNLSKYKVAIPESDYKQFLKDARDGSDYSKKAMSDASEKSHIIGDVVTNYKKFADGLQAIVFATDISTAEKMSKEFNDGGITASVLTSKNTDQERLQAMIDFRSRKIKVLVNVDLFDEGLDIPALECVILARPTKSLSKYLQQVGRALRPAKGKEYAIIIDHVGNVMEHGLPCSPRTWTLDRIKKRGSKVNLIKICKNVECCSPYDRTLSECPFCGYKDQPVKRNGESVREMIQQIDGDLFLLDPEDIRQLPSGILESPEEIANRVAHVAGNAAGIRAMKNQKERIETQKKLSEAIAVLAGKLRNFGFTDRRIHKYFYIHYGMTITEALSMKRKEMQSLMEQIEGGL